MEKTEEMKQLEEKGGNTKEGLTKTIEEVKKEESNNEKTFSIAREKLIEVKKAVIEAEAKLQAISTAVAELGKSAQPQALIWVTLEREMENGKSEKEGKLKKVTEESLDAEVKMKRDALSDEDKNRLIKALEEEAERVAEKRRRKEAGKAWAAEEEEEEIQAAEEAVNKTKEKNKDGSSSPALLHSPLLLLVLLCVLGCTLVC